MSMPSRQWTRLARVAIATVLSATGAVALVPGAASAADDPAVPGAIVTDAGCTTSVLPDDEYSSADATLASPIRVHGSEIGSLNINRYGSLGGYSNVASLDLYAFWTGHYASSSAVPPTYGQITYGGRPALCVNWLDHRPTGTTLSADVQTLVVDRGDLQAGDFDVVFNYDNVSLGQDYSWSGYAAYDHAGQNYHNYFLPGSGEAGAFDDANTDTGLIHGSRSSGVLGRYVYRFRGGLPVTTTDPETTVEAPTPARSAATSRTFTYAVADATEEHLRFECRVTADGEEPADFATCDDEGTTYDDLADGTYTFEVRAVDTNGQTDPTPASATFEVDTTGPVTELGNTPDELTNDNTPTFTWSSTDEDIESFECNLNQVPSPEPSPWYACESGDDVTNLGDGDWRFAVRGTDDLDNEGEPASYDFTIDTEGPTVELTETPDELTNDNTPTFAWSSEDDASFACNLGRPSGEPSPWEECTSGEELTDLGDGDWTFQVRATDAAGNDGEPTSYDFTIDTEKSAVTITGKPAALGNDATPSFTYAADPSTDLDHFLCVVVPEGAQFASPETCDAAGFTSGSLTDGAYIFSVVAVDTAGNESDSAFVRFTVDTTAPETSVTDGPSGVIGTGAATFGFASSETPSAFECRISGAQAGAWQSCAGSSKAFAGLADGTWTFEVRATDAVGNTDATPATRTVVVNLDQPTITATASSPTPISEFGWYRDTVTITYTCAGNGSAVVSCPAPREVPRAQQGKVVFKASVATADGDTAAVSTTLFIDKGKPQAEIKGFSGKKVYSSMPKPRCKASDPRSGIDTCKVSVTKVKKKNGDVWVVVKARATDKAGNVRVVKKKAPFRAA